MVSRSEKILIFLFAISTTFAGLSWIWPRGPPEQPPEPLLKPDFTYQTLHSIPLPEDLAITFVEVRNVGNASAEDVQIKISFEIQFILEDWLYVSTEFGAEPTQKSLSENERGWTILFDRIVSSDVILIAAMTKGSLLPREVFVKVLSKEGSW